MTNEGLLVTPRAIRVRNRMRKRRAANVTRAREEYKREMHAHRARVCGGGGRYVIEDWHALCEAAEMTPLAETATKIQLFLPSPATWREAKDGDDRARDIFERHYSRKHYADGRRPLLFVGPGEKMVLLTATCDALFVWRKFLSGDGQQGVNCAVFRNEGPLLSSFLIEEACGLAWERWPGERLYTYVNPRKVRSPNPGYCFLMAGFKREGVTKWNKLLILARES